MKATPNEKMQEILEFYKVFKRDKICFNLQLWRFLSVPLRLVMNQHIMETKQVMQSAPCSVVIARSQKGGSLRDEHLRPLQGHAKGTFFLPMDLSSQSSMFQQ